MHRLISGLMTVVVAAIASGCGEVTGTSGVPSDTPTPQQTPASEEVQKGASEIITDAAQSMKLLQTYHATFSGTDSLGTVEIALDVDNQEQATGSITINGTYSQVVITGTTMYVQERGVVQLLLQQQVDSSFQGKWIKIPSSIGVNLDTLRTSTLLAQCIQDFASSELSARSQFKIDGQNTLPVYTVDSDQNRSVMYVALDDSAHLIHWTIQSYPRAARDCTGGVDANLPADSSGAAPGPVGDFTFSAFNKPVHVLVPSGAIAGPTPVPSPTQ